MKLPGSILFLLLVLIVAPALLWLRSPIQPVAWQPGPQADLAGVFAPNELLADAELMLEGQGTGPEDVLVAPDGWVYTGYQDGRILRFRAGQQDATAELFAQTGGRPLGLAMNAAGYLIVADAGRGLLAVSPAGQVDILVDSFDGEAMLFVDDLDLAADGTIWFSDASQRFGFEKNLYNFFEPSFTGRLFSYDPRTQKTTLHMDGLFFANGVALGPKEQFVLVNETGMARIHRLWLKGPRAGESEIFIEGLPGLPDNLSFNGRDRFWVALVSLRQPVLDSMADKPLLRKLLAGFPPEWFVSERHHGFVIGLDLDGKVVENLQLADDKLFSITSANEHDGALYLGSLGMQAAARMPLGKEVK